jgi:hypothetical protein
VGKERLTGDRVQHFRPRRTHTGAFAGRKYNGKTGTLDRQWTSSARHASAAGAVISECVAAEKVECARINRQHNEALTAVPGWFP